MKDATCATHAGRRPHDNHGVVNPPVYHASTILSPTLAALRDLDAVEDADATTYAVHGTPGTFAFEEAVAALEGGFRTRLAGTGLLACAAPLLCYLSAGDHLLMTDSCYGPTRRFCRKMLTRMGIETTFYDPLIGGGIRDLIRPETRVVFTESPGSLTFEVQDIPAIAAEAKRRGAGQQPGAGQPGTEPALQRRHRLLEGEGARCAVDAVGGGVGGLLRLLLAQRRQGRAEDGRGVVDRWIDHAVIVVRVEAGVGRAGGVFHRVPAPGLNLRANLIAGRPAVKGRRSDPWRATAEWFRERTGLRPKCSICAKCRKTPTPAESIREAQLESKTYQIHAENRPSPASGGYSGLCT